MRAAGGSEPVTPDTVFRLASLSKGFAGTLAVMEARDGKLDLQQKVISLVPEFKLKRPGDAQKVTFEDVLSHRTGLPPYAYDNLLESGTPLRRSWRSMPASNRPARPASASPTRTPPST